MNKSGLGRITEDTDKYQGMKFLKNLHNVEMKEICAQTLLTISREINVITMELPELMISRIIFNQSDFLISPHCCVTHIVENSYFSAT